MHVQKYVHDRINLYFNNFSYKTTLGQHFSNDMFLLSVIAVKLRHFLKQQDQWQFSSHQWCNVTLILKFRCADMNHIFEIISWIGHGDLCYL